jgi:hypothetical protein
MNDIVKSEAQAMELLPQLFAQIQQVDTTEEANEIRNKIIAVTTYLERQMRGAKRDRQQHFQKAHTGATVFCEASAHAGKLWDMLEDKSPIGRPKNNSNGRSNFEDAGFMSSTDVTRCVRSAKLDEQDRRTYYEECRLNGSLPSLNGLNTIWKFLNDTGDVEDNFQDALQRAVRAVNNLWNYADDEHAQFIERAMDNLEAMIDT